MLSMRLLVLCVLVHLNIGQSPNGGSFRFGNGGMMRNDLSRGSRILANNYSNRNLFQNQRRFNNQQSNFNSNRGFNGRSFNNAQSNFINSVSRNQDFSNRNRGFNVRTAMGSSSPRPRPNYFNGPEVRRLMSFINKYRGEVDATNMYTMKWSNRLAMQAAERSSKCVYHNQQNSIGESLITVPADYTGSNMVDYIMKHWYDEKNTFRLEYDCRQTESCRYSQMIWSDSAQIGCASHWCNREQLVVCLFHNKGNRLGQKPYIHGNHCELCRGRCVNQLCAW